MTARKSLSELELKDETLPAGDISDLPEFGGFAPPPQPGPYRFRLPENLGQVWEPYDSEKGQRIRAIFDKDAPLYIVASPGNKANGDTFHTRLSNQERKRGDVEASDLDYLLRAFGEKQRPTSNRAYAEKVSQCGGKEFGADITFNFSCNPNKDIRVYDEKGELQDVPGHKGCGYRFYSGDGKANEAKKIGYVGKQADGTYPTEVQCHCGAVLRAFANLDNIRA